MLWKTLPACGFLLYVLSRDVNRLRMNGDLQNRHYTSGLHLEAVMALGCFLCKYESGRRNDGAVLLHPPVRDAEAFHAAKLFSTWPRNELLRNVSLVD